MQDYWGIPDERLRQRLKLLVEAFIRQPNESIPQACGSVEATKGAYRFLDNKRVRQEAIVSGQRAASWERVQASGDGVVLVVQDTTSFDFSSHRHTTGLGMLENVYMRGLVVHTSLAVSEQGMPWGVLEQQVWVRPPEEVGKSKTRKQRPIADKESVKWLKGLPLVPEVVRGAGQQVVVVADRESDIYEVLQATTRDENLECVIRVSWNRALVGGEGRRLFETVRQTPIQHTYTLPVQGTTTQLERDAQVSVRFTQVTLKAPYRPKGSPALAPLPIGVVEVVEDNPPPGQKPVHWLLFTSLPLTTLDQALTVIRYYTYRWLIERFHFTLKSGCRLAERQLQTAQRLQRLLAVFSLVAWALLWLTYQARLTPDAPASLALSDAEWQALAAYSLRTARPPKQPPTLRQAVRWIAQLGGFLGRKADGDPGVKVLWRGWQRLQDITHAYLLFRPTS